MANCPKCNAKLHLYNVSQFCPKCGVNMRFYGFEENFYREAKIAELTQAAMHIKIRRLKAAFIGTKLNIVRLAVILLPLASLLLPAGSFSLHIPFKEISGTFSALGLYGSFTDGSLNYILSIGSSALWGSDFNALKLALFLYISVAVFALAVLVSTLLCFCSLQKMQKVISGIAAAGVLDGIAAMIAIGRFASSVNDGNPLVSGKFGFGLIVAVIMFGAVIAVNMLLDKKGIPVEFDEGKLERSEIYKKVKSGEIDLDSLPQPVVETQETRKIDEEIAKESALHQNKTNKEATQNG